MAFVPAALPVRGQAAARPSEHWTRAAETSWGPRRLRGEPGEDPGPGGRAGWLRSALVGGRWVSSRLAPPVLVSQPPRTPHSMAGLACPPPPTATLPWGLLREPPGPPGPGSRGVRHSCPSPTCPAGLKQPSGTAGPPAACSTAGVDSEVTARRSHPCRGPTPGLWGRGAILVLLSPILHPGGPERQGHLPSSRSCGGQLAP